MSARVELRGVTKRFGAFEVVSDVSLGIAAGEFLTLLGPSGCGKTTLLRLIAGFEQPSAGSVWLGDTDVTGLPPYRRPVNQVFQSYALFPHLDCTDNVVHATLRASSWVTGDTDRRTNAKIELRWDGTLVGTGAFTAANGSLVVRAVKAYYDGALGSRGAQLLDDYTDLRGHRGVSGSAYGFDRAAVAAAMFAWRRSRARR